MSLIISTAQHQSALYTFVATVAPPLPLAEARCMECRDYGLQFYRPGPLSLLYLLLAKMLHLPLLCAKQKSRSTLAFIHNYTNYVCFSCSRSLNLNLLNVIMVNYQWDQRSLFPEHGLVYTRPTDF
jgi:hypothetical protein